jgi:hypothetical protein
MSVVSIVTKPTWRLERRKAFAAGRYGLSSAFDGREELDLRPKGFEPAEPGATE